VHWTPSKGLLYQAESMTWFSISSDPTQICFCDKNDWNCTEVVQTRRIYPGQDIEVSAIAVDQSDVAIPSLILGNLYVWVETRIHKYQKASCMKQEGTAPAEIILCHQ